MLICNVKWIFLCSWHAIHQFIYFYLISFAFRNAWIGFTCVEEMKNKKSPLSIWRSFTTNMKVGSSTGHCGRVCWMVPWGWKNLVRMFHSAFSTGEISAFLVICKPKLQARFYQCFLSSSVFPACSLLLGCAVCSKFSSRRALSSRGFTWTLFNTVLCYSVRCWGSRMSRNHWCIPGATL